MKLKILVLSLSWVMSFKAHALSLEALCEYSGLNDIKPIDVDNTSAIVIHAVNQQIFNMYRHYLDPNLRLEAVLPLIHSALGMVLIYNRDSPDDVDLYLERP